MEKPILILTDDVCGSVIKLHAKAVRTLREAGLDDQAAELLERGIETLDYLHMLQIVAEYLDIRAWEQ